MRKLQKTKKKMRKRSMEDREGEIAGKRAVDEVSAKVHQPITIWASLHSKTIWISS